MIMWLMLRHYEIGPEDGRTLGDISSLLEGKQQQSCGK